MIPCSTALMKHLPKLALNRASCFHPIVQLHTTISGLFKLLLPTVLALDFGASRHPLQRSSSYSHCTTFQFRATFTSPATVPPALPLFTPRVSNREPHSFSTASFSFQTLSLVLLCYAPVIFTLTQRITSSRQVIAYCTHEYFFVDFRRSRSLRTYNGKKRKTHHGCSIGRCIEGSGHLEHPP